MSGVTKSVFEASQKAQDDRTEEVEQLTASLQSTHLPNLKSVGRFGKEIRILGNPVQVPLYVDGVQTDANHGTGAGITDVLDTKAKLDINTFAEGTHRITMIDIDLTGLNSGGTDGDIIGKAATANCQLLTFDDDVHGQPYKLEMYCLETPAGGDADIDVQFGDAGTNTEDAAPANAVALLTAAANWAAPTAGAVGSTAVTGGFASTFVPPASDAGGKELFLTSDATDATYTAGKYLIKIYGISNVSILA